MRSGVAVQKTTMSDYLTLWVPYCIEQIYMCIVWSFRDSDITHTGGGGKTGKAGGGGGGGGAKPSCAQTVPEMWSVIRYL